MGQCHLLAVRSLFEPLSNIQNHPHVHPSNSDGCSDGRGLRKAVIKMSLLCVSCCTIKADFLCFPEGVGYLQVPLGLTGGKVWLSPLQLARDKLYAFCLVQVILSLKGILILFPVLSGYASNFHHRES